MHKKQIKRAIQHLKVFEKQLDREKRSNTKLYKNRERKFQPTYKKILKL